MIQFGHSPYHHYSNISIKERALILGCAISIDFDYFSRHSTHTSGGLPLPFLFPNSSDHQISSPVKDQSMESKHSSTSSVPSWPFLFNDESSQQETNSNITNKPTNFIKEDGNEVDENDENDEDEDDKF